MLRLVVLLFICSFLCPSQCFLDFMGLNLHNRNCLMIHGYFQCNNGECIPLSSRCDVDKDCKDGSDEEDCDNEDYEDYEYEAFHACKKNEYKCKNTKCIPAAKFCDLVRDCEDGSDEYYNCVRDLNCSNKFRCSDQHCILHDWVCDGSKDCSDGSDEWNCNNKTSSVDCKIENSQYLCANQRCIALDAVCNVRDDCGDKSDEGDGCRSSPTICSSAKCDYKCKATPKGTVCICKPGYKLKHDNRTCEDIDECQNYGICDQTCINYPGSYNCSCQEEYSLSFDKKTCKANAGEATMLFSTKTKIMGMYLESKITFEVASHLNRATGVAINGEYTYWSDIKDNKEIIVRKISRNNYEAIVTTGLSKISGIAVDWITDNIYFTDEVFSYIGLCNSDGTNCTVLINKNDITEPTSIALLPTRGKMYWSDQFLSPRIAVAGMDGKNIRTLVSENVSWPISVTIDYPNDRLYWVDSKLKIFESIRLDGTDRRQILHDVINQPFSLAIFENMLYWSDWGLNLIESCNKFSQKDWRILQRLDDKPYGIHIDHSALKPKIDNPCKSNPCSQLCMLNQDKGYTCACTLDKELNADKHTCREKRQHLLIVTKNTFINYYHEILGKPKVTNISEPLFIHCVTSDPSSGQIIMQSGSGNIVRYDPVDNTFENIMHSSINPFFSGIAFDHIGNNLYTFNVRNKSIEVHNVKTLAMTAFYYFDYKDIPSSITLAPEESKMFVAVQRNFFQISYVIATNISIYEMRMDGLGERKLLRSIINEEYINEELSMCYDRDSKTLFTSDGNHGNILSFSKQEWRVLRTGLRNPGSLAVAGDILFWIEHDTTLFWTNLKITSNHKTVAFRISQKPIINILHPAFIVTLRKDAKQEHGCQKNNGNCSHVCLVSSITSFICACPPGMELLSDNRTCVSHHECPKDEFKCSEHILCIKKEKLCDGIIDCPNGEDETINCENKENRCKKDQFMCKNSDCISLKDRCNSHFDCTDQSDEENCEKPKCKSDEFQCRDGTCIPNSKVCDNIFDCFDFSDEQVYTCPTVPTAHTCAPNEFRCNDLYRCIPNHFVCDGERDCTDGEDEAKCNPDTTDCHGNFRCTNGDCISLSLQCNGIDDCQDGSDERHCLNKQNYLVNCTADEYHCLNTAICLPKKLRCNGVNDCPRNDDEHNCLFCFDDEFACNNKKCIPEKWVCDKKDDCDDNSDEKDCGGMIIDVAGGCNEFKCSNGACLAYNFVCDGYPNCEDGSDENGKCQIACTLSNSCKGICYKTPKGAVCGCPHGYRLASDAVSCEDINECEQDVCSQICQNTVGSYECSCYDRYIIRSDKVSCKAVGSAMKFIVATENDIRQVSSNFHLIEEIHSLSDSSVSGFDVHAKLNFVYWSNEKFGTIKKLGIETRKVTTVMVVEHPAALAVDWVTDNVYVIDNSRPNTIKVCDLERPRCAMLVTIEDEARAISLIVDPIDKFLFWSQITWQMEKPFSKIYRANMMGVDMKIISSQPGMVIGMTIDYIKSKLYWTNNDKNTIESSNLDGSQYSTYLNLAMHPSSISIYEQSLYWLMGSDGLVKHCQLYGRKLCFVDHHVGKNNYKHFTILHTSRQPFDKNPCMEQDCDYMCVLEEENDATCICSDGKPIKSNSTCTINTNEPRFAIISSSRNTRPISSVYSILVIVLLVGVLLLCIYYYYQRNKLKWKSANDYRCTSIRFQNPSFDRRDEVEVILNSVISDLVPGHHEYANPIDDKLLKSATECSAQKSNQCSKENGVEETEKESALLFAHIK